MHICINMLKCLFCQLMQMKKSEVKTCTGNGLLDIWGLVIQSLFMVGVTLSPINANYRRADKSADIIGVI